MCVDPEKVKNESLPKNILDSPFGPKLKADTSPVETNCTSPPILRGDAPSSVPSI